MSCERDHGIGGILLAFLAGAAIGAAVAILATPKSGPEVRDSIAGLGKDFQKKVRRAVEDLTDAAGDALDVDAET